MQIKFWMLSKDYLPESSDFIAIQALPKPKHHLHLAEALLPAIRDVIGKGATDEVLAA